MMMDPTYQNIEEDAARQRFESFRLGKGFPSQVAANHTKPSHARSHSRNTSVSSSVPAPPNSTSTSPNRPSTDPLPVGTVPSKRPNSHHRRRSSVSTRRESAEMMGVAVPELAQSLSDDNINLGDKDSVRRRALWALEGKPDVPYSKVEIPELSSFENERKPFEFPTKPSFPPGTGAGYPMMGKRDSFKLLTSSSSSKDQLHTLVEEEEEDDEVEVLQQEEIPKEVEVIPGIVEDLEPATPIVPVANPPPVRPKPAHLKLRPLSLTPENLVSKSHGLPTPPSTASSSRSSLNPSGALKSFLCTNIGDDSATKNTTNMIRLSLTPSPSSSSTSSHHTSFGDSPTPSEQDMPRRRSSISYKISHPFSLSAAPGLPTPEATPTSERRRSGFSSISSIEDDVPYSRPLSVSEQHFLFKSHQALLARINDLERGLALRTRPSSYASDGSSQSSNNASEPTDEMLQLVADLKAERDELKRDVDGWRTRVSDLENHISIYVKRVEAERRDAWVARSRVTLLDVEKSALEKALDEKTHHCEDAVSKCDQFRSECDNLRASLESMQTELNRTRELEEECCRLRAAVLQEKTLREQLQMQLQKLDPLATPTAAAFSTPMPVATAAEPSRTIKRGLGFESVDSESSTDVESSDNSRTSKTVAEDTEEPEADLTDEDELARYEDEEESDVSFRSGSSLSSLDDFRCATRVDDPALSTHHVYAPGRPSHHSHASLSRTWTFPKTVKATPDREEVDHFFNCLGDSEASPPLDAISSPFEDRKGLFSRECKAGDGLNDDDMPPFFLPCDIGEEVVDGRKNALEVVIEEDEEEEETKEEWKDDEEDEDDFCGGFEVGGIKITFTPPQPSDASLLDELAPTCIPDDCDDDDESFVLNKAIVDKIESSQARSISLDSSRREVQKQANPPSSIPRAISLKSIPVVEPVTPPKASLGRFIQASGSGANGLFTPPSKRGGTTPSFIPQLVSSPSRNATPSKQRVHPSATFIPQPPRRTPDMSSKNHLTSAANGLTPQPQLNMNQPRRPRRSRK